MDWITIITFAVESVIIPVIVLVVKLINAQKCQLRSEMLRIYYRHQEEKVLHEYEYENFIKLFQAYKGLKGNSFIDKVHKEITETWTVVR